MHVSSKGDYGLRVVLDLALHYGQGPVQSADIAARQNIPDSYLVQLLGLLRKAGLVQSVRGPKGGYSLAKRPGEIAVGVALTALEGPVDLPGDRGERAVHNPEQDVLREVWDAVEAAIEGVLTSVTFGDLCRRCRARHEGLIFQI